MWVHPRFKPECSKKQEKISFENKRDTMSSHYFNKYLLKEKETETYRRGRRISGRVCDEVKRLEGSGGERVGV